MLTAIQTSETEHRRAAEANSVTSEKACKLCMLMAGLFLMVAAFLITLASMLDLVSVVLFLSLWMFGAGTTLLLISYLASDRCQQRNN